MTLSGVSGFPTAEYKPKTATLIMIGTIEAIKLK